MKYFTYYIPLLLVGPCTRSLQHGSNTNSHQWFPTEHVGSSLPLVPLSVWPSLYLCSCGTAVLLVLDCSQRVALRILAALMCLWEEESSGSSHYTIFLSCFFLSQLFKVIYFEEFVEFFSC